MKLVVRLDRLDGRRVRAAVARLMARRRDAIEDEILRDAARRRGFDGDLPDIGDETARGGSKEVGG